MRNQQTHEPTPASYGVMSAIAGFYSKNLAAEVTKGLTQKIATGGTPGRAPLGYLNVRKHTEEGREYRTVEVDPSGHR